MKKPSGKLNNWSRPMYNKGKFLLLLLVAGLSTRVCAQQPLSLEEAIRTGLENNYGIRIAHNLAEIDANNRSYGTWNFLPDISANATRSRSIQNSENVYSNPALDDQDISGAESTTFNTRVSLNWTVFDGLRMFISYEQLGKFRELGEKQLRFEVETTVARIIGAYYNIVQQQKTLDVLRNSVEVSEERIEIAETQKDLGSGSEYDLLQARADLNEDRAAVIRAEIALEELRIGLNELLGRQVETEFAVNDSIEIQRGLEFDPLKQGLAADNIDLSIARSNRQIAELDIKNIRGERFPEVELTAGYGYNRNESGAGFVALSRSDGFNYGVTARINILDGLNLGRRTANAKIQLKNSELALEETRLQLEGTLYTQFRNYQNSLRLVELENENLAYAESSLDIALERFRLGTITSIELREAQRTLLNAESRLIAAEFRAKLAETELLRISGKLIGEQ